MANFADLLKKIANNSRLTPQELDELGRFGEEIQQRNSQVAGIFNQNGVLKLVKIIPETGMIEVLGDIRLSGGDVTINSKTGDQTNPYLTYQIDDVQKGQIWYDRDNNNLIISNNVAGSVISTLRASEPTGGLKVYDTDNTRIVHSLRVDGVNAILKRTTNPSYVDGYVLIYFYSDGAGTDELRARGKIGAVETQVTLANLSP